MMMLAQKLYLNRHVRTSAPNSDPPKPEIIRDPVTGLPVLDAGAGAPLLSSKEVLKIQADFP